MPTYTIQRFDRRHRPLKPKYLVCGDDDEALGAAALTRHSGLFTLSEGARQVWSFKPQAERASRF